jgi:hypothetical protein
LVRIADPSYLAIWQTIGHFGVLKDHPLEWTLLPFHDTS